MREMTFPGTYIDARGEEAIEWRVYGEPGYTMATTIRGVRVSGFDPESLEPEDAVTAGAAGLTLDRWNSVTDCTLTGHVPVTMIGDGEDQAVLEFGVTCRADELNTLDVVLRHGADTYAGRDDFFEDAGRAALRQLPPGSRAEICLTCGLSDYSPGGQSMFGMRCHRDAREQYLAVRSKAEYWPVPLTENVPEFYRCPMYEPRVPGTGYRG